MKWVLAAVGVLALALATLVGVGLFALSPTLIVQQQVQIDRHRSIVYPLASSLSNFAEWFSLMRLDPGQFYEVQGSAGIGQTARYRSPLSQIGEGAFKIVAVTPNSAVAMTMTGGPLAGGAASAQYDLKLEDASGGAQTTWQFTRDCGGGLESVVCRYVNLSLQDTARKTLTDSLARLKRLAETMPALDISDVDVSIETRPARPFAYVESAAEKDDQARVVAAILGAANIVQQFLASKGVANPGPRVVVMTKDDDRQVSFRVGFVLETDAVKEGDPALGVRVGETPSGRAGRFVHAGGMDRMPVSYALFNAYLRANRIQTDGLPWEVLVQPAQREDQSDARMEIYIPVK